MKLSGISTYLVVFLLVVCSYAYAEQIPFKRLSISDGLSNSQINCIYKDSRGFMWFGTASGLNRFDGYDFRVFKHRSDDSLSLLDNGVKKISEDALGRLWVLSISGYSIYDASADSFLQDVSGELRKLGIRQPVRTVFFDEKKNLWAALGGGGIIKHDFFTQRNRYFSKKEKSGIESRVVDLKSRNGKVWLLYSRGEVACIDIYSNKIISVDNKLRGQGGTLEPTKLLLDSKENVWVSSYSLHEGLAVNSKKSGQWQIISTATKPMSLSSNMISDIEEDCKGRIWVSTDQGGICIIDLGKQKVSYLSNDPMELSSLSDNAATSLYCDDLGIMWVGTYKQGISYTHDGISKFNVFRCPDKEETSRSRNDCNAFFEDKQGNIWVGTNGGGLICYNKDNAIRHIYKKGFGPNSILSDVVICLYGDSKGRLWVGSYMGGLDCFDGKSFRHFRHDAATVGSISSNCVYAIHEDRQGSIWVGTLNGTVDRYDEQTSSFVHYAIGSNLQNKIIDGFDDNLLIATPEGVVALDRNTGKSTSNFFNSTSGKVQCRAFVNDLRIDRRGLFWMTTNDGLLVFDQKLGRFLDVQQVNESLCETSFSLLEDRVGNIWVGASNGLFCITPTKSRQDESWKFKILHFDKNDGLQSNLFNANGALLTSNGEIIEGGVEGYNRFRPSQIFSNKIAPKIVFTDFSVSNSSVSRDKSKIHFGLVNKDDCQTIKLKYAERNFTVQFAALSYINPQKNQYRYILEGFDKQWTSVGAAGRRVTYTNMNPGTYTLKVEASNNDGVWNTTASNLKIIVMPPFWATNFAYIVYVLLFVSVVYLLVRYLIERQRKRMQQEQIKFETQRMLDLDEMKLQFFTNISHELRTPLTLILSPLNRLQKRLSNEDDRKLVSLTQNNAQRLLSLVNQLLDFRKVDANAISLEKTIGDIVSFVKDICNDFKDLADRKGVEIQYKISDRSILLEFDEDKIYKAISNLISNALKYTSQDGCIKIWIDVDETIKMLRINVSDNGIGISDDDQKRIFERFYRVESNNKNISGTGIGLHLAYEFVKMHGGDLTVESKIGEGSCFTISLPMVEIQNEVQNMNLQEKESDHSNDAYLIPEVDTQKGTKYTLFIVDDNEEFLNFMVSVFSDEYVVMSAKNGKTALKEIEEHIPDLVISDVMMPELDGFELCRQMHSNISTSHIPVVLLTAKSGDESKIEGLESGASDYVCKPFNIDILQLKIARMLQHRELLKQKFQPKKEIQASEITVNSLDEKLVKKAIDYVESNMDKADLSVEDLSAHLAMSRAHLYKKMVAIVGKTPIEFIRILRLKRAAQLLEKSQMSVSEVAYSVGFNDPKYFRKYFKDEFQVLPSEYKQRCEAEHGNTTVNI